MGSLGGASLQGHRMGGNCRAHAIIQLSGLLERYCSGLADRTWLKSRTGNLQKVSAALGAVLLANNGRPLVLEAGVGHEVSELTDLRDALTEVLEGNWHDSQGGLVDENLSWWWQARVAATERHKKWIRECLKAANPWVSYDTS